MTLLDSVRRYQRDPPQRRDGKRYLRYGASIQEDVDEEEDLPKRPLPESLLGLADKALSIESLSLLRFVAPAARLLTEFTALGPLLEKMSSELKAPARGMVRYFASTRFLAEVSKHPSWIWDGPVFKTDKDKLEYLSMVPFDGSGLELEAGDKKMAAACLAENMRDQWTIAGKNVCSYRFAN